MRQHFAEKQASQKHCGFHHKCDSTYLKASSILVCLKWIRFANLQATIPDLNYVLYNNSFNTSLVLTSQTRI